jgi:hypothetical protein
VIATVLWLKLAEVRALRTRQSLESRVALAAGVGALLLMVAVVFWLSYLIFGPVQEAGTELANGD